LDNNQDEDETTNHWLGDEEHANVEPQTFLPTEDDEPILPDSYITRGMLLALVFAFFIRYHLTKAAKQGFLILLNIILPGCVPKSIYSFKQKFAETNVLLETHYFCPTCEEYIGRNKEYLRCSHCNLRHDLKFLKAKHSYFIVSPLKALIKKMLEIAIC
jgi:DNA-directed RNA polymerase subunit RPC12/RpoP